MTKRYTVCLNPINILGGKRKERGEEEERGEGRRERGGEEERRRERGGERGEGERGE